MRHVLRIGALACLMAAALTVRSATAQVGTTTDVITGTVQTMDGVPLPDANLEAISVDTKVSRRGKSDAKGRFSILFPDGGGQYRVIVRMIGMQPLQQVVQRRADEDRLVVNFKMSSSPQQLDEVVSRGRNGPPGGLQPPTPGTTELNLNPNLLARLPIDAGDLAAIAALAPGVVFLNGTDSTASSFSVAGLRPTSNVTTLDGLTFGGSSIPQDAVRSTRVITSTYDVARGQFSGGLVASTTRSGTNEFQATITGNFRDRAVALGGGNTFTQGSSQQQVSFGAGGPIIKDKFFVFASAQGRLRENDQLSLRNVPPATLQRLGVSPDSVARFLATESGFGVPTLNGISDIHHNSDMSAIVRFDYLLGQSQTLTLRGDYRATLQNPARIGTLGLPETGGRSTSAGGGVMLTLSSRFGGSIINELRTYVSGSSQRGTPSLLLPQGRVLVSSALDSGTTGVSTLVFGGNPGFNSGQSSTGFEGSEELSYLPGSGEHRIKFGAFFNTTGTTQDVAFNRYGTYSYQSLADLDANQPSTFTRTLSPIVRNTTQRTAATYLGDVWRVGGGLQLTYGLRAEHSDFGDAPAYNAAAAAAFGIRTDQLPSETHVSPRAGFTWTFGGGEGPPVWILRGGAGEFRSPVPAALAASAQSSTGLQQSETQLVCVGPAVPAANWSAFASDPSTIPTQCATVLTPLPSGSSPTVTAFQSGFQAPRAWRGSLGLQRRLGLLTIGGEFSLARGVAQSGFRDLNLGAPQFYLADEGGRPVYAAPGTIDPRSGAAPLYASRLDQDFGQVFVVGSDLKSRASQATFTAGGIVGNGITVNTSYTWSRAFDQSSFSGGSAAQGFSSQTTAGDPNVREYAPSDFDRRHTIVSTITLPLMTGFELTWIGRLTSGAPYTPSISGDVNADGSRNDRAYIFNPATAVDPAVAAAMTRLLAAGNSAASCLATQLGAVAGRNTCRGPWQPSFDLQFNVRPAWIGGERRLTISLLTSNLLAGVDQLFHGPSDLHGWGGVLRPDQTLLYVTGFDPNAQRYTYTVNERFGSTRSTANAIRIPFQLALQVRLQLGPINRGLFGGGGGAGGGGGIFGLMGGPGGAGGPGGGGPPPGAGMPGAPDGAAGAAAGAGAAQSAADQFAARLDGILPNAAKKILDLQIGLRLTDEQVVKLTALSDSFVAHRAVLGKQLQEALEKARKESDQTRMFVALRPLLQQGRDATKAELASAQQILTPEQWAQVPDEIKTPRGPGGGPGGRGGGPPRN